MDGEVLGSGTVPELVGPLRGRIYLASTCYRRGIGPFETTTIGTRGVGDENLIEPEWGRSGSVSSRVWRSTSQKRTGFRRQGRRRRIRGHLRLLARNPSPGASNRSTSWGRETGSFHSAAAISPGG